MKKKSFYPIFDFFCICIFFSFFSCKQQIQTKEFFLPSQEELLQTELFFCTEADEQNSNTADNNSGFWKIVVRRNNCIEEFFLQKNEKSFLIETDLFSPIAVFAYPFQNLNKEIASVDAVDAKYNFCLKDFFLPAGTVFPGKTQLSWLLGFEANILSTIYSLAEINSLSAEQIKNYAAHFNWEKFAEVLESKEKDFKNFYNPWNLEKNTIISAIKCADFKNSYLTQSNNNFFSDSTLLQLQSTNFSECHILSNYIPQNNKLDCIALKQNKTEIFLYKDQEISILSALVNSQKELSLELN